MKLRPRAVVVCESPGDGYLVVLADMIENGVIVTTSRHLETANRICTLLAISSRLRSLPIEVRA